VGLAEAAVGMSGIDALLRSADEALYQAKAAGRDRIIRWSPPPAAAFAAE
jgi:PleD family two-component response regulator